MVESAKTKVNKSAAVREMLKLHPGKGPTEISKMLKNTQNIDVPASMVSNIKSAVETARPKRAQGRKRGRPPGSKSRATLANGNGHGYLDFAFDSVAKVGGLAHAQLLMDRLKEFKAKL